jgi:hypothetical protein
MAVSVPAVTSMVMVPLKVVPVIVATRSPVPETLNVVIVFALAGVATQNAVTAVNMSEQRIAAKRGVFIVISRFGTDERDYCRSKLATGKGQ